MKKYAKITINLLFTFVFLLNSALAQSLFQGPATGTSDPGAAVSTVNFSAVQQAAASQHVLVKRPKGKHHISLIPNPPNLKAASGPAGSNVFIEAPRLTAAQTAPTLLSSFNGIDDAGNVIPPDPHMAAGPNDIMATINVEFGIWDKQGNKLFGIDANSWFSNVLANADPFDPQIIFDHYENRWVMIWVGGNLTTEAYLLVSVSDDSDPLGTWFNWAIRADRNGNTSNNNLNDYPKLGYDDKNIYVTSNQFDLTSLSFQFVQLRVIEKTQMYNGTLGSVTYNDLWDLRDPDNLTVQVFTVIPAVHLDVDAEGSAFLINDSPFVTGTTVTVWEVTDPAGAISLSAADVAVTSSSSPPDAEQLGDGSLIDVGGRRFRNAVFRADNIWTAHSVAGGANDSDADARYVRVGIDNSANLSLTLNEDVALHLDSFYHSYPAIMVGNDLSMTLAYTRSSATEFAGAFYTGRLDTDPSGLAASTLLKPGEDNYVKTFGGSRNRWGDYMGTALDPTTGNTWMFVEYADLSVGPGTSDDRWGTWFGEVNFATDVPPTITSVPNTAATVDQAYAYDDNNTVEATGTQPITFSLVSGPTGFTVASDGLITWTPTISDTGINNVQILASNTFGTDIQNFDILVSEAPPPSAAQLRINSGGADFTDINGDLFVADKAFVAGDFGFQGGTANSTNSAIAGTDDDLLYQTFREGSSFGYIFDNLTVDDYTVTLFFTEPFAPRSGARVFDVTAEGTVVLDNFEIFVAAGGRFTAHTETFIVNVSDGQLNIDFDTVSGRLDPVVSAISVVGSAPPVVEPNISVTPLTLDFGDVNTNATKDSTVTITNIGNADLLVSGLTTTNSLFSVVSPATPVTVVPQGSEIVTVRFSPTAVGAQSGNLDITSDDPDQGVVSVTLAGNGVTPPPDVADISVSPLSVDFGQVVLLDSADAIVTVSNIGTQVLTVSDLATTNAVFTVVSPATPFDVAANNGSQDVVIRFKPTVAVVENGDLTITSNDPDQGIVTVTLTGEGIPAPVAGTAFRVNAGGSDFTDSNGELFVADKAFVAGDFGFQGGSSGSTGAGIAGTTDDALYQSFREGDPFSYIFDNLATDDYAITLFFMEPRAPRAGGRVFDVTVEGTVVLNDLDIFVASGSRFTALTETFIVHVADGQLNIDFNAVSGRLDPILSAIAVVGQGVVAPQLATQTKFSPKLSATKNQLSQVPDRFELQQNYPNPFNPETVIRYSIPTGMNVSLKIYNVLGQEVLSLVDKFQEPGEFSVKWTGTNAAGNKVTSGIYVYQLKGEGVVETRKMILLQ